MRQERCLERHTRQGVELRICSQVHEHADAEPKEAASTQSSQEPSATLVNITTLILTALSRYVPVYNGIVVNMLGSTRLTRN